MRKRNAIAAVAALGGVLFAASAFFGASADAAPAPPPACTAVYFDVSMGQGVDVFCNQVQGPYQVVAQCDDGLTFWSTIGTVTESNAGPSVAICHGDLLTPAHVVSYYIAELPVPRSR